MIQIKPWQYTPLSSWTTEENQSPQHLNVLCHITKRKENVMFLASINIIQEGYENLKIALLQLMPGNSLEENLAKGADACKKAKKMGADIALFPEMWSSGYKIFGKYRGIKNRCGIL